MTITSGEPHEVLVLRHGETKGYHDDVGLTPLGEQQAHDAGRALAERLGGGGDAGLRVRLRHAPTARAAATATSLRTALVGAVETGVEIGESAPDAHFDSLRFLHDGRARESSSVAARRLAFTPDGRVPDWVTEYDRFDTDYGAASRLGGPIDRWMTAITRHFEPPQVIVYRAWAGVRSLAGDADPGSLTVVLSHSALLRAVAATAIGADPGEPVNLETLAITVLGGADAGLARVRFRDHDVTVEVPSTPPPWLDASYLDAG